MSSIPKKLCGGSSEERAPDASHQEVASSNLAPRSIKQAIAAGFWMDPVTRELGRSDGLAGIFRLTVDDILEQGEDIYVLAYLDGWQQGDLARKRRG